jgi:heme oxygenase
MQQLLTHFREATRASHETLDAAFGSLNLAARDDYVRFLSGHAIGLASLARAFRRFVEDELDLACPDYVTMLREDLAQLGVDADALPQRAAAAEISPAAAGYVISGSRLGLAMLSGQGYWGRDNGVPSAYMEDTQGLTVWKAAVAHLKDAQPGDQDAARERRAAVAAFDTFRNAFEASATMDAR